MDSSFYLNYYFNQENLSFLYCGKQVNTIAPNVEINNPVGSNNHPAADLMKHDIEQTSCMCCASPPTNGPC